MANHTPDLISTISKVQASDVTSAITVRIVPRTQWTKRERTRFDALVTKEALGELSRNEALELDALQRLRRKFTNPPTGEEILRRYQRERLDEGMIQLVERYVRFEQ